MLVFAVWRVLDLNNEAGSTLSQLARERTAVAYQQSLFDLLLKTERFRLQTELVRNPAFNADQRELVDRQMRLVDTFTAQDAESFDVAADWANIEHQWTKVRNLRRTYRGRDLSRLTKAIDDFIYKVEHTSSLEYENDRYTQDLADMLFARIPELVYDSVSADLIGENAQTAGSVSIADRVHLAGRLNLIRTDPDFSSDDWGLILQAVPNGLGTSHDAARYAADSSALLESGRRLSAALNDQVLMRAHPAGDPAATRGMAHAAIDAAIQMNADAAQLLDRQLVLRMNYELMRNRYLYAILILSAVFLIGIMLIVADVTARRNRDALTKAQQESARLTSELARQKAERALRLTEAQFRAVFDGAALGIAIFDRNGGVLDANHVFRSVYGDNSAAMLAGHEEEFAELMRGERDLFEFEQHVMAPDGQEAWTDCTISLVNDDAGNPYFAICMFRDLTELKRNERRMLHDMTHDALTGLPNRALFEAKLREEFADTKERARSRFAILIIDLDRLKDINESLGHQAGDFIISQAGHRLRSAIDAGDLVARLGGDEFAVLVRSVPDVQHVETTARRALRALSKAVALGSRSIFVSASVGIAIASGDYLRAEDVMRDADIAMRYAKGLGSRFAVFDTDMHAGAQKRLQLTTGLRLALERDEFAVLYQPIVNISDGEPAGCEALLRWNHPSGTISPSEFIPLAEQTGLAIPIGRFVLRTVCEQIVRWKRASGGALFPVNVNVSATELLDPEFETVLLGAVREFGVEPGDLTLEITESVVLDTGTQPNALVERLRTHGFKICIDDFGTGYSSLRYLQQFKVDAIKIDRSFVSGSDGGVASEPIVRTLMALAEAFEVRVVAEGIETQRQRDALRTAGCRFGQGYYYSQAVSAEALSAMYPALFGAAATRASG